MSTNDYQNKTVRAPATKETVSSHPSAKETPTYGLSQTSKCFDCMQCIFHEDEVTGSNRAAVQGYCQVMHIDVGRGKRNCSAYVKTPSEI